MTTNKYVLAIGELLVDALSTEQVTDLSQAKQLNVHAGGSTANFCRYLRRCGTNAHIVSAIGNDGFGKILLHELEKDGLSTANIQQHAKHFTSLIIVARTAGTPDFIPYRDADKFIENIDSQLLQHAAWVHSTAFALSANPSRSSILSAFEQAHRLGVPVSVDWNYSDKIWANIAEAKSVLAYVQQFMPYLKFSLDDVSRYTGITNISIDQALEFLENLNASVICLTCGGDGVYYKDKKSDWQFIAAQPIEVKNATGAGDSFWAGYVHAQLSGATVESCVQNAVRVASLKLQGLLV